MALHFHVGERASIFSLSPSAAAARAAAAVFLQSQISRTTNTKIERGRARERERERESEGGHGHPNPPLKFAIIARSIIRRSARAANCHGLAKNHAIFQQCN